jgi:predicted RND superfamily exporter protein
VIGFLSLNFSDTPPFRDLGNITSMGVAASFLYSIILLPALLAVIPLKSKESKLAEKESLLLAKLANWVILKRGRIIYSSLILTMALSVFAFRNDLNNQFINFFDETVPFRSDSDYIDEKLTGMYTIEFSLPSGQPDGISNPAYLKNVSAFEEWFAKQENVVHVNAFTEVIRRVNKSMHGDQEKYYTLPASQPEAAQYLLLYEMSLPYGLDLNNQINVDKSETRFTATVKNISSKDLLALTAKAENWLKENAPEYMHESGVGHHVFSHYQKEHDKYAPGRYYGIDPDIFYSNCSASQLEVWFDQPHPKSRTDWYRIWCLVFHGRTNQYEYLHSLWDGSGHHRG